MRPFRIFLTGVVVVAGLLTAAVVVAYNPDLQTWWVRREFARRPALGGAVGAVAIRYDTTEIRNLRLRHNGAVLEVPLLEAEVPVAAVILERQAPVHRLTATGWTLDLTHYAPAKSGPAALMTAAVFRGVFEQLRLPLGLALDGVDLEGVVKLPPAPGQPPLAMQVTLTGGGMGAGQEGRFHFVARAMPGRNAPGDSLALDGLASAAMDTPRTFTRLAVRVTAVAASPKLAGPVKLTADFGALRQNGGETYTATFTSASKQLAAVVGGFSGPGGRLAGTWNVDLSDDDLTPFAFGRTLPVFAAAGQGHFDTGEAGEDTHVSGTLNGVLDRLAGGQSPLTAQGSLRLAANFDMTRRQSLLRVDHLTATVSRGSPILVVRSLQAFAFEISTGELQVADAHRDLLGVTLQGVPIAWFAPWLPGLVVTGDPVRGELVASAREGGLSLATRTPLTVSALELDRAGQVLVHNVALTLNASADYTPQGWQVEFAPGTLSSGGLSLLAVSAKLGRLAGPGEPIKVAGHLSADLPLLLAQPGLSAYLAGPGQPALQAGTLTADYSGSVGPASSIQAKFAFTQLSGGQAPAQLPDVSGELRIDLSTLGRAAFSVPLMVTQGDRRSDLNVAGSVALTFTGLRVEGQVTSEQLNLEDALILGAPWVAAARGRPAGGAPTGPSWLPSLWSEPAGLFKVTLKSVDFGTLVATDVTGMLAVDAHSLAADRLVGGLADGGHLQLKGKLSLGSGGPAPCGLVTDLTLTGFDPAGLCRRANPETAPTIEGKFDVSAHLEGQGASPAEAAAQAQGDCQITSKGGIFRALSTEIAPRSSNPGKAAVIGALLGTMASAVTDVLARHKPGDAFTNPALAMAEVAKDLSAIRFDQLSVTLSRGPTLDTVCQDLALISPDLRLAGGGRVTYQAGVPLFSQPLALDLKLGVRGRLADALNYVGLLAAKPDDLGYKPCVLPLRVGGSLGKPDTSDLQATLLKLAYDRSGAAELVKQLQGK